MATDLELDLPDGMVAVHRHGTAGLRPGDTLVLLGKLARPVHDEVVVRARGPEGPVEARFRVDLEADRASPVEHRHLPRTWAQAEIAHITQTRGAAAKDEIVALSRHYTVMSRHTSLIVLENDAMYREFNVVRAAKGTDKWDGSMPTTVTETVTTKSPDKPGESPQSELRAQSGATATPVPEEEESRPLPVAPAQPEPTPDPEVAGGVPGGLVGGDVDTGARGRGPSISDDPLAGFDPPADAPANDRLARKDDEDDEKLADVDVADDGDGGAPFGTSGGTKSGGSSGSGDGFDSKEDAPKKTKKTAEPAKKKPSSSSPSDPLAFDDIGGGGGWGGPPSGGRWGHWRPLPQLKTRPVAGPDSKALARVESLRLAVTADPTQRNAHGNLVRAALRAGHTQSLEFARAWAEVDPDHPPALMSLADAMAADGDPMTLRAYESVLEVQPFAERQHAELARAYESKGDLVRACSHRRAVVSIDPQDGGNHVELARCLAREGRAREALDVVDDGNRRATTGTRELLGVSSELASRSVAPASFELHGRAELQLDLTWSGEGDLELAVVDTKGRRLSGLRPEGKVRVRESAGREQLTLKKVKKSVFVEITRPASSRSLEGERGAVRGELVVKTPDGTKRIPVSVSEGTVRVAKVFWVNL
jgi:hypothetical protein